MIVWWRNGRHREVDGELLTLSKHGIYLPKSVVQNYGLQNNKYCMLGYDRDANQIYLQFTNKASEHFYKLSPNGQYGGYKIGCSTFMKTYGVTHKRYVHHKRCHDIDADKPGQITLVLYEGEHAVKQKSAWRGPLSRCCSCEYDECPEDDCTKCKLFIDNGEGVYCQCVKCHYDEDGRCEYYKNGGTYD